MAIARKINPKSVSVSFLLDETGSMISCKDATISGFNEYISGLRKGKQNIRFTLTKFDSDHISKMCDDVRLNSVPQLNDDNYVPGAMTPLYDAIGRTIKSIGGRKRNVLFVIMTDGEENASQEYNMKKINEMIKEKEAKGWTFVYLGANQDSWANAQQFGLSKGNVMNYHVNSTRAAFDGLQMATQSYTAKPSGVVHKSLLADNIDEEEINKE